ncbi:unnamed protein product [Amoebophrya sp. A25]|nr:unnamed protein product [Amoebophrya sp. A25]|eukprot:GSA25T00001968001.1
MAADDGVVLDEGAVVLEDAPPSNLDKLENSPPSNLDKFLKRFRALNPHFVRDDAEKLVCFFGDSDISHWKELPRVRITGDEGASWARCVNVGVGGAEMLHVAFYSAECRAKYRPDVVVLCAGENDLGAGAAPPTVFSYLEKSIAAFGHLDDATEQAQLRLRHDPQRTRDNANVVSSLPIDDTKSQQQDGMNASEFSRLRNNNTDEKVPIVYLCTKPEPVADAELRREYERYDGRIKELFQRYNSSCQEELLYFIDNSDLRDPSLYAQDGLHLSRQGYQVWDARVRDAVERVLLKMDERVLAP